VVETPPSPGDVEARQGKHGPSLTTATLRVALCATGAASIRYRSVATSGRDPPYKVEWLAEAWAEVMALKVFVRRPVMRAADELAFQAEVETRNRKPLRQPIADLPDATWEVRILSKYRLLYGIYRAGEGEMQQRTVEILRAIIKKTETTDSFLRREK
jgi:hypothetical protein